MLSANKISEIKEQAFCGVNSSLDGVCNIKPLTIKEIVTIGTMRYKQLLGILLLDEVEIANLIKEKTGESIPLEQIQPLSYLLQNAENSDYFSLELQLAFTTFIGENILLLPKIDSVLIGSPKDKRLITKDNFRDFQDILRIQNKKEMKEPPPENESFGQRKMRLLRERVEEAKRKQAAKEGNDGLDFSELLEIASVYGIDFDKNTLYGLYALIKRFQAKEKWDQDIRMLCAGADSTKIKTQYWADKLTN